MTDKIMVSYSEINPEISIVIPVYNEEESLPQLFKELYPVMENLNRKYEIIFINDGSQDKSFAMLYDFQKQHEKTIRVVDLNGNFGQHMAITSGFANVRGNYVITLDADLQNPPEEIPKLIAKMDEGYDVVGTYRQHRHDPLFRKVASRFVNKATNRISGLHISDYGCMLRGYSRRIVDIIVQSRESTTFIPALGQKFAVNPIEIPVAHREREFGESKYSFFRLLRLNFDLMTSFSIAPLQMVTMSGMGISLLSIIFFLYMIIRRFIVGSEAEGLFTLMALNFFLLGVAIMALGIIGEYTGRIYKQIQQRPHYIIRHIYEENKSEKTEGNKNV